MHCHDRRVDICHLHSSTLLPRLQSSRWYSRTSCYFVNSVDDSSELHLRSCCYICAGFLYYCESAGAGADYRHWIGAADDRKTSVSRIFRKHIREHFSRLLHHINRVLFGSVRIFRLELP
ncbi:hypothetical protein ANCCAN_09772 [Ancylostoma caninum]|uniref:Uncharacterized protein n=1 Tax=Ancylostoma caninum TaxID=29170 RepID=A0A368GIQ0_ANCCA|nr:hypothetical protein ANCCAN_09772 [Ancylostoma caninum]